MSLIRNRTRTANHQTLVHFYQFQTLNHQISPYFPTVTKTKTTRNECPAAPLKRLTPSGLEPVNIKWIPLTPGRAVQYNGELEIARRWKQT